MEAEDFIPLCWTWGFSALGFQSRPGWQLRWAVTPASRINQTGSFQGVGQKEDSWLGSFLSGHSGPLSSVAPGRTGMEGKETGKKRPGGCVVQRALEHRNTGWGVHFGGLNAEKGEPPGACAAASWREI